MTPRNAVHRGFDLMLDKRAFYGLAGDAVRAFRPHTEAADVAILIDVLAPFGNAVGPGPFVVADGAKHGARINAVFVGPTSRARKGTAVEASVGEPFRFHELRHSHVALLIAQGEHPSVIASRLGHTSTRVVLDRYGHLFSGIDGAAADRLDHLVSNSHADARRKQAKSKVIQMSPKIQKNPS